MAAFVKKPLIPESVVEEGTAKRNILRKGGPTKGRKETAAGKYIDDGYIAIIDTQFWSRLIDFELPI